MEEKLKVSEPSDMDRKITLRSRVRFWFCDRLGVVPCEDFNELFYMTDELGVLVFRNNKVYTEFMKHQHEINQLINASLRLGVKFDKENVERGMIL